MRKADAACGMAALALGLVIALEAQRIPDPGADAIGPGAFPFTLGLNIAACGAVLCAFALGSPPGIGERSRARWLVLGAALALLVLYTQSLAWLGFILTTAVFIPACLALLGERGLARLAAAGIVASIAIFLIFGLVLGVDLPTGRLFAG
jgi:putative tricarboxylic transport membrane protein